MEHEQWLKQELMKALSWDDMIVDGVVDVISKAGSADDEHVQDIVQNFMDNSPVAIGIIADYMEAKHGSTRQQQQQHQHQQQRQQQTAARQTAPVAPPSPQQQQQQQQQWASYSTSVAAAAKPSPLLQAAAAKKEKDKWLNLGGQQQQQQEKQQAEPAGDKGQEAAAGKGSAKQTAEATLSMFKRGGRIQSRPKPGETATAAAGGSSSSSGAAGGQRKGVASRLEQLTAGLERQVANCLSCGKIYDCRNLTNDIIAFVHGKFACTFCGAQVAMTQQQRIAQAQQPQHSSSDGKDTGSAGGASSAAAAEEDATTKAVAFKDRLVDYDRHSQKRTTVIDDQSDYFEIDTNAWLSEEERAELKRRAEADEAAAAARRNRVTVTLDLLGRKVLMAEGPDGSAAGGSSGASFQTMSASEALRQGLDASSAPAAAGAASAAAEGGAAGAAGAAANQGSSAAQALEEALAAIRDLRISVNPTISTPPPVFVPMRQKQPQEQQQQPQGSGQTDKKQRQRSQKGKQQQQQQQGATGSSSQSKPQPGKSSSGAQRRGGAAARAAAADARVQDDSIFTEFEAELLMDERLGNSGGSSSNQQQQPLQHAVPAS